MASKKDKFRKEVKKSLGQQEDPSMEGIVGEIAGRRTEKSRKAALESGSRADSGDASTAEEKAPGQDSSMAEDKAPGQESSPGADKEVAAPQSGAERQIAKTDSGESVSAGNPPGNTEDTFAPSSGGEMIVEEDEPGAARRSRSRDSVQAYSTHGESAESESSRPSHESAASSPGSSAGQSQSGGGGQGFRSSDAENGVESSSSGRSERIDSGAAHRKTGATSMARKRESIYNVSSDVRLEDYTEADRQKSNSSLFKMAGVVAVLLIIGLAVWQAATWLMAPTYQLAVANQEITSANIEQFSAGPAAKLSATSPVHIRFQWEPGELETDYLKILVERDEAGNFMEEAVLGRRPPRTASYIYFMGPLDSGKYRIQVLDASGSVLADRDLELQ